MRERYLPLLMRRRVLLQLTSIKAKGSYKTPAGATAVGDTAAGAAAGDTAAGVGAGAGAIAVGAAVGAGAIADGDIVVGVEFT